ncbi:MAG: helix-turn-helix transcriptional regulator [Candidatus Limnocylindrales bacterium]
MAEPDVTTRRPLAGGEPLPPARHSAGRAAPPAVAPAEPDDAGGDVSDPEQGAQDAVARDAIGQAIATSRDATGAPLHRGWLPVSGHHRWLEPFVLMALAGGSTHGYAIIGVLTTVGMTETALDVGQVYRTLRDLEQVGQISSTWTTGVGPARRDYTITELGSLALDEWAAVMKERGRLIAEFDAAYLGWVAARARRDC